MAGLIMRGWIATAALLDRTDTGFADLAKFRADIDAHPRNLCRALAAGMGLAEPVGPRTGGAPMTDRANDPIHRDAALCAITDTALAETCQTARKARRHSPHRAVCAS